MWWVALIMIPLALLQVPSLVNRKQWGELAGYSLVWLMAATYALLVTAGSPSPAGQVLRTLLQALYRFLSMEIQI